MSVKWKTKTNKLPKVSASLEALSGRSVEVGALAGDNAWL